MWYVAKHEQTGQFAVYDPETQTVGFTSTEEEADWDAHEAVVQGYIDRFQLQHVKPKPGTGLNHPPKPPISSM